MLIRQIGDDSVLTITVKDNGLQVTNTRVLVQESVKALLAGEIKSFSAAWEEE
jgi:hypothetical protein